MRIIVKARQERNRPKLVDILNIYRKQSFDTDISEQKEKFQKILYQLYGDENNEETVEEKKSQSDQKYNYLMSTMQRIQQ